MTLLMATQTTPIRTDPYRVTKDAKDFRFYYNGVAYTAGDIAEALEFMIAKTGRRPGTVAAEENETP